MESGKPPIDPSLALINDEILSTQVRLMELYVKQAQATAANESARTQERLQAELAELQAELEQKNLALEKQKALFHQPESGRKADLRARPLPGQRLLEARGTDLGTTDALRQRIAQLESTIQKAQLTTEIEAARARETWQAELAALKGELERKESPLPVVQRSLDEVEGRLGAEIQDLRAQLAGKVELLEHRTAELQNARTQIALLQQRIQQLELTGAQTEEAASEGTRIRKTLQAELVALRAAFEQKDLAFQQNHTAATELERRLNSQLRGLQSQLAEKQGLLETRSQEIGKLSTRINGLQGQIASLEVANKQTVEQAQSAARTLQDGFRTRLQELEATVSEKADLLQNRTTELESAQAEIALLQERMTELELSGAQKEAVRNEAERIHGALQNELSDAHRTLQQKDRSFAQKEAEFRASSERLHSQLSDLQNQLAENQQLLDVKDRDLDHAARQIAGLEKRVAQLGSLHAEVQAAAATEADRIRQESQFDRAALQTSLREKEQALQERQAAMAELEANLTGQIQNLKNDLIEKQELLKRRNQEFQNVGSETASLRDRIAQLESASYEAEQSAAAEAERVRVEHQAKLATIEARLNETEHRLAESQVLVRESEGQLQIHLNNLEIQIAEKQLLLETRTVEISSLQDQLSTASERITELEFASQQAIAEAARNAEIAQQRFDAELAAHQEELRRMERAVVDYQTQASNLQQAFNVQSRDLKSQLAEKQELLETRSQEISELSTRINDLQEQINRLELVNEQTVEQAQSAASTLQDGFRARLQELEATVSEKTDLLQNRTAELESAQAEIALLQERMTQLELNNAQTEATAIEASRIRETLQTELVVLRTAVEQKDLSLQQTHAATRQLDERLNAQLHDLQSQLAEKQGLLETRSQEISELTAKTSDLQEQIICLELANKQTVKEANAAARALEDSLRARVQELEAAVSEKAQGLENSRQELESAQSEIAVLRQRIEQLELARVQTEEAKNEADRMRKGLQNELNNVQQALEQKNARSVQREAEFKESSGRLQAQLSDLQSQLAEERAALESQTRELRSTQSEITALRDKIEELESAKLAADTNASTGINRLREQYQLELASLRAELEQKQVVLEERQRSLRVLEEKLNSEIHRLETQLAEKQSLLDRGQHQLQEKGSEISALRQEIARSEFARRQTEMLAATQAEQIRERVKAEVEALDAQLREKDNALKSLVDRGQELESRIDDLRQQLAGKESLLESRDIEVTGLRTQAHDLLDQITHMEQAQEQALEQQQLAAGQSEQNHRVQVHELQNQLTEKLTLLETRNKEVQALESKVAELVERIDQSEVVLEQARATAANEMEQIRRQSEAELTARQAEVERKVGELQDREAALYSAEQNFKVEIDALRTEVAEKRFLLENRNEQLLRVKMEADELQDRIIQLESAVKQVQGESLNRSERTGEYTRTALDRLWEKEERQAAVNDLEQNFRTEIDELRSELVEKQALLENPSKDFLMGDPTITEAQKEKLSRLEQLVEAIKADNEQTLNSPHNRKWRFSLSRKRRWKF